MKSMNLKKRIFLGFSVLIGMVAVYGVFYYISSNQTKQELVDVIENDIPVIENVLNVSLRTYELRMQYLTLNSATDPVERSESSDYLIGLKELAANDIRTLSSFLEADQDREKFKTFKAEYDQWLSDAEKMIEFSNNGSFYEAQTYQANNENPSFNTLRAELTEFQKYFSAEQKKAITSVESSIDSSGKTNSGVLFAVILLAVGMAFFISRSITKPLSILADRLSLGADQSSQASQQVASSSQVLASGSSQQAASVEETSASLEEMAAMTKHNTENANSANDLSTEAQAVVDEAFKSMNELVESMNQISASSEETQKIIKTIDEIAFQTNLLALNAAVEAARAGEAGAGFAVVADEVRNLAMRAAEAAKSTASLIDESVQSITQGNQIVERTNTSFTKVAEATGKISELVGEIAAGSKEQTQGIDQLNSAVGDIDRVVQDNAATAEETAASSEELSAQSEEMKVAVNELINFIGGAGLSEELTSSSLSSAIENTFSSVKQTISSKTAKVSESSSNDYGFDESSFKSPAPNHRSAAKKSSPSPSSVFPMDDDELNSNDFIDF